MSDHETEPPRSGPWSVPRVPPPQPAPIAPPPAPQLTPLRRWRPGLSSIAFAVLLFGGLGIRMYDDLSRPDAFAYWKDLYVSPSMTASVIDDVDPGVAGSGRRALAISGEIGAATASWFRDQVAQAKLQPGDVVMMASPGGNLGQSMIMGEIIRAHGLSTVVGKPGAGGHIAPAYCASACVTAFAGGKLRIGLKGSKLGVHRFVATQPGNDPVASAQRIMGHVLSYMTRMGVSSTVVEAMSATDRIRWLDAAEASQMKLVTESAPNS